MIYVQRAPRAPLSDFVELLWLYDGYAPGHDQERLLPTGTVELVVNLRDDQPDFRAPILAGPHSESSVLDTSREASILGVHFKPGGAFPFLGVPAGELHNLDTSLDALWGSQAGELRQRALEAPSVEARFRVLEECLLARARTLARHPAVAFALHELGQVPHARTVAAVADAVGLSHGRFIDRFRDEVGLTPKLFCRVRRFQEVVRLVHTARAVDWADVALSCGYFDQAHFIHDFREFSGMSPSVYLARKGEHQNHVPLGEPGSISYNPADVAPGKLTGEEANE
jgi:AraC-like DNA-binding protein